MDLADRDGVIAAAAQAVRVLGRVDVLVNNAIAHLPGSHDALAALDTATVDDAIRANFAHQLLLVQRVLPCMVERGSGVIINVCSGSATTDPPSPPDAGGWGLAYSSSKAAARGFDTTPPQAAAAAAVYLASSPPAVDRLLGKVIWAPKLAADLGLLDA